MSRSLAVEADLRLTVDGEEITVSGVDNHLTVAVPTVAAGRRTLRALDALPTEFATAGTRARDSGLSVDVTFEGVTVARLGPFVEPDALSRALGIAPARVRPGAIVRALGRRLIR
ncbi:hypothetical protein [Halalkalicoccus ordinarius]|uniref:hypothetical protein n=1 Tax=Halalkalicoccus ordinarius TaxID=3116651 RepID=UPI00300F3E56